MKVCILGHFADMRDEGVRIVGHEIARELQQNGIEVRKVSLSSLYQIVKIFTFNPDIIHFVLSPTISGLLMAKMISLINPGKKIVISAIHPAINEKKIYRFFAPDLMLAQSKNSENLFTNIGFKTKILPNGVNIKKFYPYELHKKRQIREKYKVPLDNFVILHLASITKERNLEIFCDLQKERDYQVIIIGRINEYIDLDIYTQLENAGCTIWIEHIQNIEEIYNLADCYIFPTLENKACIEFPLSVLEAMACNIPVITTRFGAIPQLFQEGEGVVYFNNYTELNKKINFIQKGKINLNGKEYVSRCSWEKIVKMLIDIYDEQLR